MSQLSGCYRGCRTDSLAVSEFEDPEPENDEMLVSEGEEPEEADGLASTVEQN